MDGVSKTAIGVGLLRAMHRIVDREPWVLDDDLSLVLFGRAAQQLVERDGSWVRDASKIALRAHVLVRSAFAEERLRLAVVRGVRQYVALGAGYDTFPYRQPAWMESVRVFEVDAPATQADKRERLEATGIDVPPNVAFVPMDFERTPLSDALEAAGFDPRSPAFFSWLGVVAYLTRDAIESVLQYVASLPPASEIVFTFAQPSDGSTLERDVAKLGEPLRSHFVATEIETMLRSLGYSQVALVSASDAGIYLGQRTDGLVLPQRESLATAVV